MYSTSYTLLEKTQIQVPVASLCVDRKDYIPIKKDLSKRRLNVPEYFAKNVDRILNFEGRDDDTYVVTQPKCGTTWMLETAWLVLNDFDFEKGSTTILHDRAPYLEFNTNDEHFESKMNTLQILKDLKSPRLIKSHLPASVLPTDLWKKKSKVIYVARNVKDAFVSAYHFWTGVGLISISIEEYAELFLNDRSIFHPFWEHSLEFYEMRNEPNIYFTSYERMSRDLKTVIKDLCVFLGKPIPDESILDEALKHLSFESMKHSLAGKLFQESLKRNSEFLTKNRNQEKFEFLRKGKVGSFKNELSEDIIRRFDEWEDKKLKEAGVTREELYGV
ncbi:hypothetical protein ACFFRR_010384 [Megaselia abdita]